MLSKSKSKFFNDEGLLDSKYYIWFILMLIKAVQVTAFPNLKTLDFAFAGFWLFHIVMNLSRPREMIFWFMAGYFTNILHWFTDFAFIKAGGSRILLLDVFLLIFLGMMILQFIYQRKYTGLPLGFLFAILTVFWGFNLVRGILDGGGGYVIGEGRFYFASVLLLGIVNTFSYAPEESYRKIIKIITLCSINVIFYTIMIAIIGPAKGDAELVRRFNPGNGLAQILLFGMLVAILDFTYGKNEHILKYNKVAMIGAYLGIIFIAGVRGILVVTALMFLYFMVISQKLSLGRKVGIVGGMLFLALIAVQLPPVQKVLATQMEYISIMKGEGDKHAKTTSDFRAAMWAIFWEKLTEDEVRMLTGRPFGLELIDISSLNWNKRAENTLIDNSLAHNDYLAMSMTNGMVFTGLLLLVIIIYIVMAFSKAKRIKEYPLPYFLLFFGWCLFSQLFQSGTNAEIKHFGWSVCLWVFLGVLGSLYNYLNIKEKEWKNQKYPSSHPHGIKEPSSKKPLKV